MSVYSLIDSSGLIVNRIILDDDNLISWDIPEGHTLATGDHEIGGTLINGEYTPAPAPPVPPPPAPASISDRQFFQQLAVAGYITPADALAAVKTGTIPPPLQTFVDGITEPAEKFAAEMLLSGAIEFQRSHPLTAAVGAAQGLTSEQMDTFFRAAAQL